MSYWNSKCDLVEIDEKALLKQIENAIKIGSSARSLSFQDFDFHRNAGEVVTKSDNVTQMYEKGVHYLDAIFLGKNKDRIPDVDWTDRDADEKQPPKYTDVARGLFVWYFNLFTQARSIVPNQAQFLTNTLGIAGDTNNLVKNLSSCNMELMPKTWIKHVQFPNISIEAKNRLGLGAAGHRFLQALKYIPPGEFKDDTKVDQDFCKELLDYTQGSLWWEFHPITKSADLISIFGSLNELLSTILARSVKKEFLEILNTANVLYSVPTIQPGVLEVSAFKFERLPKLTEKIFKEVSKE